MQKFSVDPRSDRTGQYTFRSKRKPIQEFSVDPASWSCVYLRAPMVRKILDVFEDFLGILEDTKENKDRIHDSSLP